MAKPKKRLTLTQWAQIGTLLGDLLWDQERTHLLLIGYFNKKGITDDEHVAALCDEVFRRIEQGFRPPKKGGKNG